MNVLFDDQLIRQRKLRALRQKNDDAQFLLNHVIDDLLARFDVILRQFPRAMLIHCMSDYLGAALKQSGKVETTVQLENDDEMMLGRKGFSVAYDNLSAANLEPQSFDLAVSLLSMHRINDLPGLLVQIFKTLKSDGLFIGALPGAGTLNELHESLTRAEIELTGGASPRVYPFCDIRDCGALLQRAGFALPVCDQEVITVRYDNIDGVLADLRMMGETNALLKRSRKPMSRRLIQRAGEIYAQDFSDSDGRIRASFNINWMLGWVPHENQQKPAKRGSSKNALKDILKDIS